MNIKFMSILTCT